MCWCDDIVSIDQSKDDILIFVIVVTPYWHLPVDLSFLDEKVVVCCGEDQGHRGYRDPPYMSLLPLSYQ